MDSFWDFFWLSVEIFFFVAYLLVLFQIIGDLFRDHELSGWLKAVWIFFLLFVPFLTALVYLIARGRGMAERNMAAARAAQADAETYIRSVSAGAGSPAEEIARAKSLHDAGVIDDAEFAALKAKALQ
ncbi:SHOCT domain-containing protein [Nocardioides sp. GY 10113]|uniref:SHOCT domain-containing protein n=1 Tax=Nocardioides sp. GY 10113 TaxID=2569761 RepID=UPI0010A77D80|nr:SHOCT domain-containing protein [Nocardioides sp. GY 10113]TIC88850.1 SHOCT domain-containing protein [Nocardioides sp. GY 10113]